MRTSKIFRRTRRLIVVASFGLLLFGAIKQPSMTAYASEAGPGVSTTQQSIQQSDRWEGTGDTWRVRASNGSGYLTNSWFQDLDGSWYMLGSDGIMYSGLVTDQSTGKSYLLNTQHDGTFGRMLTTDGVYNVNGVNVYLTFNQNHDGTFGAITSGLNEVRSSGVRETSLAAIPTDSATGGQTSNQSQSSQTSQNSTQNQPSQTQTSQSNSGQPSWYGKTPEQMTQKELAEYTEYLTGNRVITDGQMSNEVVDLQG